jgi:hypothetical protein
VDAKSILMNTELRLPGHLHLGNQRAGGGIPAGKTDTGRLAHKAPAAVAPHHVVSPQRPAVLEVKVDAGTILREAGHLFAAVVRHGLLRHPAREDAFDVVLPQPQSVGMAGGKVADIQAGLRESRHLGHLPLGDEPFSDAPLIQNFKGPRMQPTCPRTGKLLAGAPLHDGHINSRKRQLPGQHQPRGAATHNHYRMLTHRICSRSPG